MTASRADVQATLDAATADLNAAPPNVPGALLLIAAARDEVGQLIDPPPAPPPPPPPPPPPSGTYAQRVAALTPPAASYSPQKTLTSLAAFKTALANLKAGDDYLVQGVTLSGEVVMNPKLSAYARFTFDHSCVIQGFTGSTWVERPAIWLPEPTYLQLIFQPGCTLTNPRGDSIIGIFGGHHIVVDHF